MNNTLRSSCFVLVVLFAVSAAGHAEVQPKQRPVVPAYTAFPDLKAPLPPKKGEGTDDKKVLAKLLEKHPRPIPEEASALTKVRTAQLNEGVEHLLKFRIRSDVGPISRKSSRPSSI